MKGAAIATAVLMFLHSSAYAAPRTLVCNGTVSRIRWDVKEPAGKVIEYSAEGEQWTVTIDTATKKLTVYPLPGIAGQTGFVELEAEGDIKPISMQASIDANKGTQWEDYMPYDGSINRITGAFVVAIPDPGLQPKVGFEYSGICKKAQPIL
jgi:hypothetical protein